MGGEVHRLLLFSGDRGMAGVRELHVHLHPALLPPGRLSGALAIVIDVLRASTTIVHALAAGCTAVLPVVEVEEARALAGRMRAGKVILGGERGGKPIPGFDVGNSPREYTPEVCRAAAAVLSTTNGTRVLCQAAEADRVLVAGFVNFSAICEQIAAEARSIHLLCAGTKGEVALEDVLLAGALVEAVFPDVDFELDDAARVAWDCFLQHRSCLEAAVLYGRSGAQLMSLGYDQDIHDALRIDRFLIAPELQRQPLRLEIAAATAKRRWWPRTA
jgi:2-phosphosulfolactate phosphatase